MKKGEVLRIFDFVVAILFGVALIFFFQPANILIKSGDLYLSLKFFCLIIAVIVYCVYFYCIKLIINKKFALCPIAAFCTYVVKKIKGIVLKGKKASSQQKSNNEIRKKSFTQSNTNGEEIVATIDDSEEIVATIDDSEEVVAVIDDSEEIVAVIDDSEEVVATIDDSEEVVAVIDDSEEVVAVIEDSEEVFLAKDKASEVTAIVAPKKTKIEPKKVVTKKSTTTKTADTASKRKGGKKDESD